MSKLELFDKVLIHMTAKFITQVNIINTLYDSPWNFLLMTSILSGVSFGTLMVFWHFLF